VFISLGGTDPFNLTRPILAASYDALPNCQIDVVSGSMSPHFADLKTYIETLGARVCLHADAQNVARLMCDADLAIGAGGTMTWERNALGLPSVVLVIADNQRQVGDAMRAADAAIVIDAREEYSETDLKTALEHVSANPDTLGRLSRNARKLGGANGAENIAKCLDRKIKNEI
jgi:spore coat polysaccharide biosynthesis predicted glycosyltransferase SpsG